MVSLRFPFFSSFPTPQQPNNPTRLTTITTAIAVACTTITAINLTQQNPKQRQKHPLIDSIITHFTNTSSLPLWGCLSLTSNETPVVDSITGASFPSLLGGSQSLLAIGLRTKSLLGLKNIHVYAFGVYADEDDVQNKLKEKYGNFPSSDLSGNKDFSKDLLSSDANLTVRLQIVYSRLSIRSVRSAFEESVGSRLQKFGGPDNKELLHRFTSQFKDDLKIPKGSVIELSREHGYVLRTTIDGEEVGSIQSKLLCESVLDLYIGDAPFDQQAKQSVMLKLAKAFKKDDA